MFLNIIIKNKLILYAFRYKNKISVEYVFFKLLDFFQLII